MLNQIIYKSTIGVHACGFGRLSEAVRTAFYLSAYHNNRQHAAKGKFQRQPLVSFLTLAPK